MAGQGDFLWDSPYTKNPKPFHSIIAVFTSGPDYRIEKSGQKDKIIIISGIFFLVQFS
jgi:hypothetical protein